MDLVKRVLKFFFKARGVDVERTNLRGDLTIKFLELQNKVRAPQSLLSAAPGE